MRRGCIIGCFVRSCRLEVSSSNENKRKIRWANRNVDTCIEKFFFRKCFKASYYYLDDPTSMSVPTACDWDQHKENGVNTAIPIHLFAKHVASLHSDGDIGFSKEYETIQNSPTEGHTVINSQLPDNKMKNRYLNILACE